MSTPTPSPCIDCGTTDAALLYRSGKMARCHDCQNFVNLGAKSTGGGVWFTRVEFLDWKHQAGHRACTYCGIDSAQLYELNVPNVRTGKRLEVIGVDRQDNTQPYTLANIQPCCPLCNAIKGSLLTDAEMRGLAPHLRAVWQQRLAALRSP
jgi:hypothetical protein